MKNEIKVGTEYKFNPNIIKWIDSISTTEQLSNAFDMLPKFGKNDIEKKCIHDYLIIHGYSMVLFCYRGIRELI